MPDKLRDRLDTAAHGFLVALFFAFPIALGAANTLMALTLVCWLLAGGYRQRWSAIGHNPITAPALMLYGLILMGTLYTTAPAGDIWNHVGKYSKLVFALVFLSLLGEERWRRRCWDAFTLAMLVILASVYASIWIDLPWSNTHTPGWGIDHHVFGDYITQNVMVAFFVVLALNRGLHSVQRWQRWTWYVLAAMGAISITHLSGSRTGYLLLAAALLTFTFVAAPRNRRLAMLAMVAVALVVGVLTSQSITSRFDLALKEAKNRDADNLSSIGHRLYDYRQVSRLIEERPLLGWGTGAYHEQVCRVVEKPEWCQVFNWHPHNQFLFFGVDHGLAGVLLFAFLIVRIAWHARAVSRPHGILLAVFAAIFFVDSMFNSPLWSSRENHFFMLVMALLMAGPPGFSAQAETRPAKPESISP